MEVDPSVYRALDDFEQQFRATGNPLFAWQAYGLCRACGPSVTFPNWLLAYFDEVWSELRTREASRVDDEGNRREAARPWQDDVSDAFGFRQKAGGGRSDPFVSLSRADWHMELATHVRVLIDHEGQNETDGCYLIADRMDGVSRTTVARAWREYAAFVRAGDLERQRQGVEQFNRELDELRRYYSKNLPSF